MKGWLKTAFEWQIQDLLDAYIDIGLHCYLLFLDAFFALKSYLNFFINQSIILLSCRLWEVKNVGEASPYLEI